MGGNGVIEDPAHQDLLFDDGQEGGKQQKRRKSDGSDPGAHAARRIADEAVERLFPPCEQQDAETSAACKRSCAATGKSRSLSQAAASCAGIRMSFPTGRDRRKEEEDLA